MRRLAIHGRFEANEVAGGFIGENVNQSVRSLTHVSHSMADTQGSLCNNPAGIIQVDTSDILGFESADEDVAMPLGKSVASVNHPPRGCNGRHPSHLRINHARFRGVVRDLETTDVLAAEGSHRPSINGWVGSGPVYGSNRPQVEPVGSHHPGWRPIGFHQEAAASAIRNVVYLSYEPRLLC